MMVIKNWEDEKRREMGRNGEQYCIAVSEQSEMPSFYPIVGDYG